mmetsp:Transcript_10264/g.26044  ORF Transcript_10264/g.26044 Transcript_10264/m.26044 type:complete len:440 (-) Transcript_10264:62-1381(-)
MMRQIGRRATGASWRRLQRSQRARLSGGPQGGQGSGAERETYGTFWEEWKKYTFPAALGFSCIALLQVRRILARDTPPAVANHPEDAINYEPIDFGPAPNPYACTAIEKLPPYRWLSRVWGHVAAAHIPFDWLKDVIFNSYAATYACNLTEMRHPLPKYKSLSDFFLRPLKEGVRQIDADSEAALVSPVDGRVLHVGEVPLADAKEMRIESVKGNDYALEDFVGKFPGGLELGKKRSAGRKLQTIVLYLAPGDYHHFHSPADWEIRQRRHFPGDLMPVRPWAVKHIKDLYVKNERVVLNGSWQGGFFSFGAVGALNVGSIAITFDRDIETNKGSLVPFTSAPIFKVAQRDYPEAVNAVRGQPVGSFNMGSTVVLVFESSADFEFNVHAGQVVRVGQRIGSDAPRAKPRATVAAPPWPGESTNHIMAERLDRLRAANPQQ